MIGVEMLDSKRFIDQIFGDPLDETLPGNAAAANLWTYGAVSFKDKDIYIVLGYQTGATQAGRAGTDNYYGIILHGKMEFGAGAKF
jgi:hypothetical protein